jgi:hypothetical protein
MVAKLLKEALDDPDPWHGFTSYLDAILNVQQHDRGLTEIINNPELGEDRVNAARETITPFCNSSSTAPKNTARCALSSTSPTSCSCSTRWTRSSNARDPSSQRSTAAT